jgi:uncharacterized membrane protein
MSSLESRSLASGLAVLLASAGVSHFVVPSFYDRIVPRALPGSARTWTLASGLAEVACAAIVAHPSTRRRGATLAALLFVAVFPANLQMAWDSRHGSVRERVLAYGRLPLQLPLLWWAWGVRRAAPPT